MDVSIIIVNYNTKELTYNCLHSVFEQTHSIEFEIIVSDNGSTDGSIEMIKTEFPQVILIENNANIGFGAANNRGADIAKGKYLFLLNSDTLLLNNAVKEFFDYAEKTDGCILGCFLCDANGEYINSYGKFNSLKKASFRFLYNYFPFLLRIRKKMVKKKCVFPETLKVDFVTGADLFLLKKDFTALSGFDENFFMYYEDSDLCRRAAKAGIERLLIDTPKIVHLEGRSSKVKAAKLKIMEKSFFYYYKKWENESGVNLLFFYLFIFLRFFSFQFSLKEKIDMTKNSLLLIKQFFLNK